MIKASSPAIFTTIVIVAMFIGFIFYERAQSIAFLAAQ